MRNVIKAILTLSLLLCIASSAFATSPTIAFISSMDVLNALIAAGAPIDPGNLLDFTESTDPNGLMGKSDEAYTSKTDFVFSEDAQTTSAEQVGGSVEFFRSESDCLARYSYIESIYAESPILRDEMNLPYGNVLLRIDLAAGAGRIKEIVNAAMSAGLQATSASVTPVGPSASSADALFDAIRKMQDRSQYKTNDSALYWEGFDRRKPVPVETPIWWKSSISSDNIERYYEMGVTKVLRGKEAWAEVKENGYSNDEPDEAHEYILVNIAATGQSTDFSDKMEIETSDFDFVSQTGSIYSYKNQPHGYTEDYEFFSGASLEFKLAMLIDKADQPVLVYNDDFWFALT